MLARDWPTMDQMLQLLLLTALHVTFLYVCLSVSDGRTEH